MFAIQGRLSVGQLTCFLNYANQYTKPFNEISGVVTELQNALACAAGIFEMIEEEPEKADAKDAVVLNEVDGSVGMRMVVFLSAGAEADRRFEFKSFTWTEGCNRRTDRMW